MNTLTQTPNTKITKSESYAIHHSFDCDAIVKAGQLVKLKANGDVTPIAALTDLPIGLVVVGTKVINAPVTVVTQFAAIMVAEGSGVIAVGAELVAGAPVANVQRYTTATFEQAVSAIALSAGTNAGDVITIGVLRSFYRKGEQDTTV